MVDHRAKASLSKQCCLPSHQQNLVYYELAPVRDTEHRQYLEMKRHTQS